MFLLWKLLHKTMPTGVVFASGCCFWASQCSLGFSPEIVNNLFLDWPFAKFLWRWLASDMHYSFNLLSFTSFLAAWDHFSSKQLLDVALASWDIKCYMENMDVRNQARFQDKKITPMNIIPLISAAIWITRNATKGTMKPSIEEFFSLINHIIFCPTKWS